MAQNNKKFTVQFPRAVVDAFRLLVLSDPQSKTQKYLICNDLKKRKAADSPP